MKKLKNMFMLLFLFGILSAIFFLITEDMFNAIMVASSISVIVTVTYIAYRIFKKKEDNEIINQHKLSTRYVGKIVVDDENSDA